MDSRLPENSCSLPLTPPLQVPPPSGSEEELVYKYPNSLALSWDEFNAVGFAGSGVPHGDEAPGTYSEHGSDNSPFPGGLPPPLPTSLPLHLPNKLLSCKSLPQRVLLGDPNLSRASAWHPLASATQKTLKAGDSPIQGCEG